MGIFFLKKMLLFFFKQTHSVKTKIMSEQKLWRNVFVGKYKWWSKTNSDQTQTVWKTQMVTKHKIKKNKVF